MDKTQDTGSKDRKLKLPRLISDGMVLQRGTAVRIWGWAGAGENVTVEFIGKCYKTRTDEEGCWEIFLEDLKAGGPYDMEIKTSTAIMVRDVLVGEVWVCSGQSNMELPMERVKDQYPADMVNCDYPQIRQFNVALRCEFNTPHSDLAEGGWEAASPETISGFSAVGYFFARAIHEKYQVPVGFIKAAIGGSPIESWISGAALKPYPEVLERLLPYKDDNYVKKVLTGDEKATNSWYENLDKHDAGMTSGELPWYSDEVDTSGWEDMDLPARFENEGLEGLNGAVWFRKEIEVPENMLNKPARLWLGRIVDSDKTYVNGKFVGEITYQYPPRKYDIPADLLRKGKNTITVRVTSNNGNGEFISGKPYRLTAGGHTIDLTGQWKYRVGAVCGPLPEATFIQWQPTALYNGMLAPLTNYTVKGALWYQGEANTSRPSEYFSLMRIMIENWRQEWKQSNLPFIFVQLPNYGTADMLPSESQWAQLREAQLDSLQIPGTAMVVAIDLGEWNDMHPLRKKDVGERLALAARSEAYGEEIISSGPIFKDMKIKDNRIAIEFFNTGSGLKAGNGKELKHFAIAGDDEIFKWAEARIEGNTVVVWNDSISMPKAVRYAWADNPEAANLMNEEGLPASPFRTDR